MRDKIRICDLCSLWAIYLFGHEYENDDQNDRNDDTNDRVYFRVGRVPAY